MARFNLRYAARDRALAAPSDDPDGYAPDGRPARPRATARSRSGSAPPSAMHIPYDERPRHPPAGRALPRPRGVGPRRTRPPTKRPLLLHYHPLVIYRFQVLKQADVVLALFLQGDQFTAEEKRADFEYYDPITTGDSTLSAVVQSIIAAEVGYHELALRYFHQALFVDLADLHAQHLRRRARRLGRRRVERAGLRLRRHARPRRRAARFDPRLPEAWTSLTYRLTLQRHPGAGHADASAAAFEIEEGEMPVPVEVCGTEHAVDERGGGASRSTGTGPGYPGSWATNHRPAGPG